MEITYHISTDEHGRFIQCHQCHRKSYNRNDITRKYCGFCHAYHPDMHTQEAISNKIRSEYNEVNSNVKDWKDTQMLSAWVMKHDEDAYFEMPTINKEVLDLVNEHLVIGHWMLVTVIQHKDDFVAYVDGKKL